MPRKKKVQENIEESKTEGCGIVNFYERIPEHFIEKVNNPNFNLHKLKIPMRMCIVAPSGSGKTNFLVNLISIFSRGEGTFQTITIITRNKDEPLYRWLETLSDQIVIKEGLNNTPPLDKFDKEYNHLVVWDDLVLNKDLSMVEQYYIRARKLNVSVIFLSQSFFKIPKIIRNNCSYMVLLKLSGNREVNIILSEFGLGITKEQLLEIYEYATAQKLQPLLIDMEAQPADRFRKGLSEIININNMRSFNNT
jgi:ABC-type dipeptide/oligopeptide/nickel transport system ATPase component